MIYIFFFDDDLYRLFSYLKPPERPAELHAYAVSLAEPFITISGAIFDLMTHRHIVVILETCVQID